MHQLVIAGRVEADEWNDGGAPGQGLVQPWVVINSKVVFEKEDGGAGSAGAGSCPRPRRRRCRRHLPRAPSYTASELMRRSDVEAGV